jgi:hypothetical protein
VRRTLWPLTAFGMAFMVAVIGAGCGGTQSSLARLRVRSEPSSSPSRFSSPSLAALSGY